MWLTELSYVNIVLYYIFYHDYIFYKNIEFHTNSWGFWINFLIEINILIKNQLLNFILSLFLNVIVSFLVLTFKLAKMIFYKIGWYFHLIWRRIEWYIEFLKWIFSSLWEVKMRMNGLKSMLEGAYESIR